MKNKILYKIGLLCGLIPLTVGLFIFFTWWIARAFFAFDLNSFEVYGFLWTLISIPIASIGLLLFAIFIFKSYPNFLRQSLLGLLLVLINIPIVYWVLLKQADLETRAYIRIYNKTKQDNVYISLKSSDFEKQLGKCNDTEDIVNFYYPKYIDNFGGSSSPTIDSVTLIIKDRHSTIKLKLPRIEKGECIKLYIDKEFNLLEKWE